MKIAIIGNSQAAALQRALKDDASRYACTFDFLVQKGGDAPKLELHDGYLRTIDGAIPGPSERSAPGLDRLDPASYDAVLFAAAGLPAHRRKYHGHLLGALLHAGFAPQPYGGLQSVSGEVLAIAIERALRALPAMRSLALIRSVFPRPFVIVTWPVPGPLLDEMAVPSDLPAQYGENLPAFMSWYYAQQIRVISAEAQHLGAHILVPPREFLDAGVTPVEFCTRDRWHMNEAYGHRTLERALQLIGAAPEKQIAST